MLGLWVRVSVIVICLCLYSGFSYADSSLETIKNTFFELHSPRLGMAQTCTQPIEVSHNERQTSHVIQHCAAGLRNDGNAPFILLHSQRTKPVIVLLHGLSDSPYYMRSIATTLHAQGHTVVVGLLPGHGIDDPIDVLHSQDLASKWRDYTAQLINIAKPLGNKLVIGGFSTGGALATDYMLDNLTQVDGLMLFSGALRLASNAETLAKIPFAKWISKRIDGRYITTSLNPYKYPEISNHAALILMDIIRDIRQKLADSTGVNIPIFAAHSQFDQVTPIEGIHQLISYAIAPHTLFEIDASMKVCHANLPLDQAQVSYISLDDPNPLSNCDALKANPVHRHMLAMAVNFLSEQ